ncbi:ribonuclease HII [Marinihelvus fidelis]|uniref:Ribonuclease HII n=1 Tax=Marinihelvus fidelis TaxID=2613842 RepID=A0A5N0T468_9GAMM|nr:ribonuclease HII [Marinihelvus fidelis]KAA9129598.1 ribonuclease HII [Marinihelvus fidelis]
MITPVSITAGVDEAGRGPLAGPVVVAAVVLDPCPSARIDGLDDSKRLTAKRREALFGQVIERARDYCIIEMHADDIDRMNILAATMEGMRRSVLGLASLPEMVLVDGNRCPELPCETHALVGGDGLEPAISAASILAKVHRDRLMLDYHQQYPGYGFDRHKGYPTAAHMAQLRTLGPCPIHRRSFAPVRALL